MLPSLPARRNPGPPPISPRPSQYKLPPPPRASISCGEPMADRQTIRGFVEDHPKDATTVVAPKEAVVVQQQPQPPQLRARRFKVPPPIKCIAEPLDRGSRESYELMTPAAIMSPNRQVTQHYVIIFAKWLKRGRIYIYNDRDMNRYNSNRIVGYRKTLF